MYPESPVHVSMRLTTVQNLGIWSSAMATETTKQRLASLLLGTKVAPWLRERRAERKPWRVIATELREATNGEIDVPIQTLINWAGSEPETEQLPAQRAS